MVLINHMSKEKIMKFKIIENKKMGYKARIKIKGSTIPIEIFYQVLNYNSFDKMVKSIYKDNFDGYVSYPKPQYGD